MMCDQRKEDDCSSIQAKNRKIVLYLCFEVGFNHAEVSRKFERADDTARSNQISKKITSTQSDGSTF